MIEEGCRSLCEGHVHLAKGLGKASQKRDHLFFEIARNEPFEAVALKLIERGDRNLNTEAVLFVTRLEAIAQR